MILVRAGWEPGCATAWNKQCQAGAPRLMKNTACSKQWHTPHQSPVFSGNWRMSMPSFFIL